jgi:hypothetical protein
MKKQEILNKIQKKTDEVLQYVEKLSDEKASKSIDNKWSVNGNVEHLISSIKPLTKALKVPKFLLSYKFGKMNRKSRTYEEVSTKYQTALDNNKAPSPNPFGPKENKNFDKEELLTEYIKETKKMIKSLNKWNESQLDIYILPHPLLGKLSIRELLFFTHYHTKSHLETIKKL